MDPHERISAPVTLIDWSPIDASLTKAFPIDPIASAETAPVGFHNIANAYGDYTKKSLEQTSAFFKQIAGVRSIDKAFELQTEFAKEACNTFLAESQKIRELHRELARQRLRSLEGFVDKMTQSALSPLR